MPIFLPSSKDNRVASRVHNQSLVRPFLVHRGLEDMQLNIFFILPPSLHFELGRHLIKLIYKGLNFSQVLFLSFVNLRISLVVVFKTFDLPITKYCFSNWIDSVDKHVLLVVEIQRIIIQ